jgi:hypothetical protein
MAQRIPFVFSVFFLFILINLSSCEKFSGDQTIPAYMSIDSIRLTTVYSIQGTTSHNITDAWVYVDDILLGAFQLPARLPVLEKGVHTVKILPGVKKNGIAATRINYIFFNSIVKEVRFTEDSTSSLGLLTTTYLNTTDFYWKEDFEDVSISLDTSSRSLVGIMETSPGPPTFEGSHSGMVTLDTANNFFEAQTHKEFAIPSAPVFLELNFNASNAFSVGVIIYSTANLYQVPIITLSPTNGIWKKTYIDLTTTLNAYPGVTTFRVYLGTWKDAGNEPTQILFDNFKLLTYKSQ